MENTSKRQFRELSDATKAKISQAMRGKSKSFTHKENISSGLKNYWKTIPNKPTNEKVGD
ncbi:MAG: NUMOD3 domain-containing DNA-binding protein [Muribaculaceae bacterium]